MIRPRHLERLAPRTQEASGAAGAGRAKFSWGAPAPLSPEQIRASLPHRLMARHLAWSSCHHVACGLQCFSVKTLGWDPLHRNLPPRPRRSPRPHVRSPEALQRLLRSANPPQHRALLMPT
jgi:hypothetical protein